MKFQDFLNQAKLVNIRHTAGYEKIEKRSDLFEFADVLSVNLKSDGTLLYSTAIFTIDEIHSALKESGFILIPEFVRGYSLESNSGLKKLETWIKFEPFDNIQFSYDDDLVQSITHKNKECLVMKINDSYGGPSYITTKENIKKFLDYLVLSGRYDIIFFLNDSLKNI